MFASGDAEQPRNPHAVVHTLLRRRARLLRHTFPAANIERPVAYLQRQKLLHGEVARFKKEVGRSEGGGRGSPARGCIRGYRSLQIGRRVCSPKITA
jgi:hypothetical protein